MIYIEDDTKIKKVVETLKLYGRIIKDIFFKKYVDNNLINGERYYLKQKYYKVKENFKIKILTNS